MSDITKLASKPEVFKLGDEDITIYPFDQGEYRLFFEMGKEGKEYDSFMQLSEIILKRSYPEATEEDRKKVSIGHRLKLIEFALKVNNIETGSQAKDPFANVPPSIKSRMKNARQVPEN